MGDRDRSAPRDLTREQRRHRTGRAEDIAKAYGHKSRVVLRDIERLGSKGSYSGAKLTRRVFEEIMQGGYVAQRIAAPGERIVCPDGMEPQPLKYDVRCYVYDGQVQLVAARLYQGQTTNFRTTGGGFAPAYLVE